MSKFQIGDDIYEYTLDCGERLNEQNRPELMISKYVVSDVSAKGRIFAKSDGCDDYEGFIILEESKCFKTKEEALEAGKNEYFKRLIITFFERDAEGRRVK